MSKLYLLKCGHVSNSTCNGEPYCVICGTGEIVKEVGDTEGLEGRQAMCRDCGSLTPSKWTLPFFQHRPNEEYDGCYDGCWGWN
jgi:hypothetical protein